MLDRRRALPCLALLLAFTIPTGPARAAAPAPSRPATSAPAPAKAKPAAAPAVLPDTFVLARVNDRKVLVARFVDAWFVSYGPVRPKPDSLGRVEFLNSMVNKEVLALTALGVNRPLGFEDRATLRAYGERVLANALYTRGVLDSVLVTDEDARRVHADYGKENRYLRIQFLDPNLAAKVRKDLVAGKIKWNDAVKRYWVGKPPASPDGDMGFVNRSSVNLYMAQEVWNLKPGEISGVVRDPEGFHLMKLVESRKVEPPVFEPMRRVLVAQLREQRAAERASRLQEQVGARVGMVYDTTNILWSARQFQGHETFKPIEGGIEMDVHGSMPDFQPADTSRVLARTKNGSFTLGAFIHGYHSLPSPQRQPVGDFESFRAQLDAMVLEPHMAEEALERGLDKDPIVVMQIENKREEIMVDHLYEDSVMTKVWIPPAERRKYYDEHIAQYSTYPTVRFASIVRGTREGADSVAARLRAGEPATAILHADSVGGHRSGSIQERRDEGRGGQYHKILFEELRPGQSTVVGPDKQGDWLVLQLLSFDPGRQLSYAEAEHYVDESLQAIKSEELLKALIARHKKRYTIVMHPELVMRIQLQDPMNR